ncbi:CrcB protein [Marmoricola sp. OAE513]|uniref:fluoride efflux transporter FluC n=1 Tax=Marmoricola sp. OAE513 TaxID=2817894 RepID=UPI001AE557D8
MSALLVALGAAVGAPARLLAARLLDGTTPWGTLTVNVLGSTLLGALVGLGADGNAMLLLGTGFCGAFTTYSAVAVQSVDRGGRRGALYAVATVVACSGAAWLGYHLS